MTQVLQAIFGGSQATQATQSTSTQQNYTDPSLSALATPLSGTLQQLLSTLGLGSTGTNIGNTATQGQQAPTPQAPITGQESSLVNTLGSQVGPGTSSAQYLKSILSGSQLPGGPNADPALAAAITAAQRPTLDNLTQTLTQDLPGRFAAAGQSLQPNSPGSSGGGSSAFDNAAALAFKGAADTSTDIASNIANNEYNTGTQNQVAAAGLDQNEVNNTISALQASALPRLIQQNGLDQGLSQFNTQVTSLLQLLQTIGSVQAPTLAANSQSTGNAQSTASKGIVPDIFKPV